MQRNLSRWVLAAGIATLVAILAPTLAIAQTPTAPMTPTVSESPVTTEPFTFYRFTAASLGSPDGPVEARFEYRLGDRILDARTTLIQFDSQATAMVPLRLPLEAFFTDAPEDFQVLVFADDKLLDRLDLPALDAYARNLRFHNLPSTAGVRNVWGAIQCDSPCGGGCGPSDDYDCDGVINSSDNCIDDPNSNQADCDGDGFGDVCDAVDGVFQPSGPVETCMTDKDTHIWPNLLITFEHHVEQRQVDVSSCNSPDRWNRWIRSDADCTGISDFSCCINGIGTSIEQVGDDPDFWCSSSIRNTDFCH